jgi:hypothetical protein
MRSDDERADNLFLRLFSYTPREGRSALEDFCSEALVWSLQHSDSFRLKFFELTRLPFLTGYEEPVGIHTQQGYKDEDDEDPSAKGPGGRFDIVISSRSFYVALESKVDSPSSVMSQK